MPGGARGTAGRGSGEGGDQRGDRGKITRGLRSPWRTLDNLEGDGSQRGVLGSFNKTRHDLTYILKESLWLVGGE